MLFNELFNISKTSFNFFYFIKMSTSIRFFLSRDLTHSRTNLIFVFQV